MSKKNTQAAEVKNKPSEKKEGSFENSKNESRKEIGAMALSAEARNEGTGDIIDTLPTGEISEEAEEGKNKKGDYAGGAVAQDDDEEVLPELKELAPPPQKVMVRKVRVAIQEEIRETRKEVQKYQKNPTKNAFELSEAVQTLRRLYRLLQEVTYKSKQFVQNIWIHISQGKKVSELFR